MVIEYICSNAGCLERLQAAETEAIFRFLAEVVSPDTFVNIMAQYRPAHRVGRGDSAAAYEDIDRRPSQQELKHAYAAARAAGLWRFDDRG